jgi:hypothetical protein
MISRPVTLSATKNLTSYFVGQKTDACCDYREIPRFAQNDKV